MLRLRHCWFFAVTLVVLGFAEAAAQITVVAPATQTPVADPVDGANPTWVSADATSMLVTVYPQPWPWVGPSYVATRTWNPAAGEWDSPVAVDLHTAPGVDVGGATLSPDGASIYYSYLGRICEAHALPEGGWSNGTVVVDVAPDFANWPCFNGKQMYVMWRYSDIWSADYSEETGQFSAPAPVASINTSEWDEHSPWISSDGKVLIFPSNRPGGYGGIDLWQATRDDANGPWINITNMGPYVNTPADEGQPEVAEEAGLLFFARGWKTFQAPIIRDVNPPVVVCTTDKSVLWPPNHQLEHVTVYVQASDDVTPADQLTVAATVSSNEPDDALGDGHFSGDVNGQDGYAHPVQFNLAYDASLGRFVGTVAFRAERDGAANGRVYTIICTVADLANNVTTASCQVTVPRDRGKK